MEKVKYTLNWDGNYGYVEYDEEAQAAQVVIEGAPTEIINQVEEFLSKELTLDLPEGDNVRNFKTYTLKPLESLENFRVCLTRLWNESGVLVEWSMPPGMADKL